MYATISGVVYDSDSEFEEDEDDAAVDGNTSPRPQNGETSDADLSDLVDDEDAGSQKGDSEGEYAPATGTSRQADETSDAGGDNSLADALFPRRKRPAGRAHPFSSEEPEPTSTGDVLSDAVRRAARAAEQDDDEAEETDESEDLNADAFDSEAEGGISREEDGAGEATQLSQRAVQRNGFNTSVPKRQKKNPFMYDSQDDEIEEVEDEDDGFFVDDAEIEYVRRREPDEESEAESTDKEVRRERREAKRQAKHAARLSKPQHKSASTSEFSDESSEDSDSEEEEEEEDSAPTSDVPPGTGKEDEEIPTINSDAVRQEMRNRAASAALNRRSGAEQSVPRRAGMEAPSQQQLDMEALFNERAGMAVAAYQQRHARQNGVSAAAGPSRLAIHAPVERRASSSKASTSQAVPRRKKVIQESESEDDKDVGII